MRSLFGALSHSEAVLIVIVSLLFFVVSFSLNKHFPTRFLPWEKLSSKLNALSPPISTIFFSLSLSFFLVAQIDASIMVEWREILAGFDDFYEELGFIFLISPIAAVVFILGFVELIGFTVVKLEGKSNIVKFMGVLSYLVVWALFIFLIGFVFGKELTLLETGVRRSIGYITKLIVGCLAFGWFTELFVGSLLVRTERLEYR